MAGGRAQQGRRGLPGRFGPMLETSPSLRKRSAFGGVSQRLVVAVSQIKAWLGSNSASILSSEWARISAYWLIVLEQMTILPWHPTLSLKYCTAYVAVAADLLQPPQQSPLPPPTTDGSTIRKRTRPPWPRPAARCGGSGRGSSTKGPRRPSAAAQAWAGVSRGVRVSTESCCRPARLRCSRRVGVVAARGPPSTAAPAIVLSLAWATLANQIASVLQRRRRSARHCRREPPGKNGLRLRGRTNAAAFRRIKP